MSGLVIATSPCHRTQARLPTRCCAQPRSSQQCSRRENLTRLAGMPLLLATSLATPAQADTAAAPAATAVAPKVKYFIERSFMFSYPPEYLLKQEVIDYDSRGPRKESPIKAELTSPDGQQHVSVVQQQVAKLKQTLMQVTDVEQLGTPEEVARLVLPPGSRVAYAKILVFPQPPKDTGTVLGVIERAPKQLYRFEALLPNGEHAEVSVGVQLGQVYLMGAAAPEAAWAEAAPALRTIADSFKLLSK